MQKFIINILDLEAAVVKVTDDTALSLGTPSSLFPPIHQATIERLWAARKGRAAHKLLFIQGSHTFISLLLILWSQLT